MGSGTGKIGFGVKKMVFGAVQMGFGTEKIGLGVGKMIFGLVQILIQ